jgi:DNA invertase Pin-like site-specific DNA recombinase
MKTENKLVPIVYCRVSSERQKREGSGLDSQEHRCAQYCQLNGYGEPVQVFRDSFTGAGDFMARPAMRQLIEYLDKSPHIQYVIVFDDLKRLARDVTAHLQLRQAFKVRGATVECPNFTFEGTPEGAFVETVIAAQGELEREQNKRQVIQKQVSRLSSGYWSFPSPKGYKMKMTEAGNVCFPTEEGEILREGLEGFAYKKFVRTIDLVRFLQDKGFYSKKVHADKHLERMKAIILDPFYAGFIECEKWDIKRMKGKHQALISEEIYYANVKRICGEARDAFIRQDIREDFPLRGLVYCSACDKKMTAYFSKSKTGKKHPYYSCQRKGCSLRSKTIKMDLIDEGFKGLVDKNKPKPELMSIASQMFEELWKEEMGGLTKRVNATERRKERLEQEIAALADESIGTQNQIVKKQYQKRIEEKSIELEEIEEHLGKKLDYSVPYRTSYDSITGMIKSPYKIWEKGTAKQKQELFSFMFDDKIVYVHEEGYRTPEKSCLYKLFDQIEAGHTLQVDIRRKASNQLKDYLKRFWVYYNSSPALQKALATA